MVYSTEPFYVTWNNFSSCSLITTLCQNIQDRFSALNVYCTRSTWCDGTCPDPIIAAVVQLDFEGDCSSFDNSFLTITTGTINYFAASELSSPTCECPGNNTGGVYDPNGGPFPPYGLYGCSEDFFCSWDVSHVDRNCVECVDGAYPIDCSRFGNRNWQSVTSNPGLSGCVIWDCYGGLCTLNNQIYWNVCSQCVEYGSGCTSLNPATSACDVPLDIYNPLTGQNCCNGNSIPLTDDCCHFLDPFSNIDLHCPSGKCCLTTCCSGSQVCSGGVCV
jgi:hypothetical protein